MREQDFSIEEFREGSASQFTCVFRLYYTIMFYFARNLIKDEPVSKDIVTDSFTKLWGLKAKFENLNNIKAFLYISTKNACFDHLRFVQKHRAAQKELFHVSSNSYEDNALNFIIDANVFNQLHQEMENLPTRCRQVFKLIYLRSLDTAEVAETLKISQRNVLNQKAKAIRVLRSALLKSSLRPAI